MTNHGLTVEDADRILEPVLHFPDIDATFERLQPITDFRKDDSEARILYICQKTHPEGDQIVEKTTELFILKCKVQAPSVLANGLTTPIPGPDPHTTDEITALKTFAATNAPGLPHYITHKVTQQNDNGPLPGGYIAYVVMTLMPGRHLMDLKFWSLDEAEREEIRERFVPVIKNVWRLGFEPYDCALRNILWEKETKTLSLVDFEHWHATTTDPINMTEREEMQRWGIVQRPPPTEHWREWFYNESLTRKRGK